MTFESNFGVEITFDEAAQTVTAGGQHFNLSKFGNSAWTADDAQKAFADHKPGVDLKEVWVKLKALYKWK